MSRLTPSSAAAALAPLIRGTSNGWPGATPNARTNVLPARLLPPGRMYDELKRSLPSAPWWVNEGLTVALAPADKEDVVSAATSPTATKVAPSLVLAQRWLTKALSERELEWLSNTSHLREVLVKLPLTEVAEWVYDLGF